MTAMSMTNARKDFTALANGVMFNKERVCISKNNKPAFALVPIEDLEALECEDVSGLAVFAVVVIPENTACVVAAVL